MVDLQPFAEADAIVNAVAERENICLKGYTVRSMSNEMVKFVPSIENPSKYYLIPKANIYHKIDIELFPLGKGHMIWAHPKGIQYVEPKSLAEKPPRELGIQCPNCRFFNKPDNTKCERCRSELLK